MGTRRRFLKAMLATLAGCVTGEHLGGPDQTTLGDDDDDFGGTTDTEVPYDPCQFDIQSQEDIETVLSFDDFPALLDDGGVAEITLDGQRVIIGNVGDCYVAMAQRCTHSGCDIEFKENRFSCPCHGSKWTFEGKVTGGPAGNQVVFPVVADADGITILQP